MVNFVITVDSDSERRTVYAKTVEPLLPPVEGLTTSSCTNDGDFHALWAAGKWTPVSHVADSRSVAIIFGDAIPGHGPERLNAEQLRQIWSHSSLPTALDGFHVAVMYNSQKGLMVSADLLGLFPIYYYSSEEVILVGSSPELFRYHPCFKMELNPAGLAGTFLARGLIDNQTMIHGVRRLAPGHLLTFRPGKATKEVLQFKLPVSTKYFDLEPDEQVEVLDQVISEAVSRHVPRNQSYCMLLSGGHDSRLVAGYLRQKGIDPVALTEALPTDNEAKSAIALAQTLGFKHKLFDAGDRDYIRFADLATKWQLPNEGFPAIRFWGFHPHFRGISSRLVTGFTGGEILGDLLRSTCPKPGEPPSSKILLRDFNTGAFKSRTLKGLLKGEYFGSSVSETRSRVQEAYESYSGDEFQRIWGFGLHHIMRTSLTGAICMLSFGAWPVLPYEDRRVLETAGGMPMTALIDRKLQRQLMRTKFLKLAKIPLSGMTFDTTPIASTLKQRRLQLFYGEAGIWKSKRLRSLRDPLLAALMGDRRYWSRSTYFNSLGWKAVRKKAEPHLPLTHRLFDQATVHKLMPPPNTGDLGLKWAMTRTGTTSTSGLKTIIGLALWLHKHPEAMNNL